jgi:hypothetical protein
LPCVFTCNTLFDFFITADTSIIHETVGPSTKKDIVVTGKLESLYQPQVMTAAVYPEIPQMTHGASR